MMEFFCKNSWRFSVINYFRSIDIWKGPKDVCEKVIKFEMDLLNYIVICWNPS